MSKRTERVSDETVREYRPRQVLALGIIACTAIFGGLYGTWIGFGLADVELVGPVLALVIAKTGIEILAVSYGFLFVFSALAFLFMQRSSDSRAGSSNAEDSVPPVGIIYLCCGDLDVEALESLCPLPYPGTLRLIVHDDDHGAAGQAAVDVQVRRLSQKYHRQIQLLRRPERSGGKAGAVNYVLDQTCDQYEYFILCDNDSIALDLETVEKAVRRFDRPEVGVVQFRSVDADHSRSCTTNQLLARSIDAFHLNLTVQNRFGWQPFIGHNAALRTSAVREVGGLTPGFFSDDKDLTVRGGAKRPAA